MKSADIRQKFLKYFKKQGQAIAPSSSLVPNNDPTVLLTTAGMQQFLPYFLGLADPKKDFKSMAAASVQKCFRTSDIDSVGDATHLTFFEMLGNFSFGDYFKEGAIDYAFDFLTKELKLSPAKLWATYFAGDNTVGADKEAKKLWLAYIPKAHIASFGRTANWWGPPGAQGPCGPCSEIHYDRTGQPCHKGKECKPNCDCGRFVEIWNLVFMQYHQNASKELTPLAKGQIDTGMGLERLAAIIQNVPTVFDTDLFSRLMSLLKSDKQLNYQGIDVPIRIVADHLRGSVFLLADGVRFSNKEQGYILRRAFRKAIDQFETMPETFAPYVEVIVKTYEKVYPELKKAKTAIIAAMHEEALAYRKVQNVKIESVFKNISPQRGKTTDIGEQEKGAGPSSRVITAEEAFQLYSTYGLSLSRLKEEGYSFDEEEFQKHVDEHKQKSRAGAVQKFGGHGIGDESAWDPAQLVIMKNYHTATHILHEALHRVLGDHVRQEGSDINPERLRFDFSHPEKMTDEQKKEIEDMVNEQIKAKLPVSHEEMAYADAIKAGALAFFKERYPDKVTVYTMGDFSKEICGGPHVENTSDINGTFKITSEKSVAAGIRRIKAIVE